MYGKKLRIRGVPSFSDETFGEIWATGDLTGLLSLLQKNLQSSTWPLLTQYKMDVAEMNRCPPEECRRTWRVVQSQDKVEGNLLPDRNQTTLEHKTERYLSDGHWLGDFESSFIFVSNFRLWLYKEANLGWHNPGFALNWPWYNPSLNGHVLEKLYLTFQQDLQQIENQDLCEWESGLDLEGDKFCPLLNHHLQLLRIANLTDVKMKISPKKWSWPSLRLPRGSGPQVWAGLVSLWTSRWWSSPRSPGSIYLKILKKQKSEAA